MSVQELFQDNELVKKANEYIRRHKVNELFEDLCTLVCFEQPQNLEKFLIEQLQLRKKQGPRATIFTEQEIQNVYNLFDLKEEGSISKDQAIKAIQTLANSEHQFTQAEVAKIPDKVDIFKFLRLCETVLGVKPSQE